MDFIKNFWQELNKKENFKSLVIFICVAMVVGAYLLVKTCTAVSKAVQKSKLEKCLQNPYKEHVKREECFRKYR